ncbi:MAG: class I SAM-dependent methyltransferase, partial [Flavobacteriaceae bacterium]
MKHNWSQFTHKSDRRYEDALTTGETESLKTHNILDDGQLEIEFIQDVITAYFGNKLSGGAALDICCGAGYMSRCLRDFNFQTTGIELNEHAVKLAQRLDPAGQYIVSDVTELPTGVTSQRFDLILIREAHPLSRVADEIFHKKLISQYLELLSPGGF